MSGSGGFTLDVLCEWFSSSHWTCCVSGLVVHIGRAV